MPYLAFPDALSVLTNGTQHGASKYWTTPTKGNMLVLGMFQIEDLALVFHRVEAD